MLFEQCYEALVSFLRGQITDPMGRATNWIYPDYPREDATMPRISVTHIGTARDEIGIGDQGSRLIATFEIGIWVNSRSYATIGGDRKQGSELREYIADEITETFINSRGAMKTTWDFLDALITGSRAYPYDPDTDLYRKDIHLDVTWDTLKS